MIYDCFLFFNEISILDIRLNELYEVIDKFIIIECTKSFSGQKKPLYYNDNKHLFKKFHDKIIHIILDKEIPDIKNNDRWKLEYDTRNYIKNVLINYNVHDEDIIIFSDVDEILYRKNVYKIKFYLNKYEIILSHLIEIKYFLNNKTKKEFIGNICIKYKNLKSPQELRSLYCGHNTYDHMQKFTDSNIHVFKNAGLHLGTLGGFLMQKYKVQNFSHIELDNLKNKRIDKIIDLIDNNHNSEEWRLNNGFYKWFNIDNYNKIEFNSKGILIDNLLFNYIKHNYKKFEHLFIFIF